MSKPTTTRAILSRPDGRAGHQRRLDDTTDAAPAPRVSRDTASKVVSERLARGWTREELARRCNLPLSAIRSIETGGIRDGKELESVWRTLRKWPAPRPPIGNTKSDRTDA